MKRLYQFLVFSFVIACSFFLQEIPRSNLLQTILPEWPLILTLLFSISIRCKITLVEAFIVGLIQDVFIGTPLGLNAGIYTLLCFIMVYNANKFRMSSVFLQSFFIALLILLKLIVIFIYQSIAYSYPNYYWTFLTVLTSMVVWPVIYLLFSTISNYQHEDN